MRLEAGRAPTAATLALCAVVAASCASPVSPAPMIYLHVVATEVEHGYQPGAPLVVAARTERPAELAAALAPGAVERVTDDEVIIRLDPYPGGARPERRAEGASLPEDEALRPSFLVDFDLEPVQALVAARAADGEPTLEDLVAWTRDAIEPTQDRGFDPASVIAANGRGDCTEFAVLFAALARSFGHPTRIAVGVVVAESQGRVQAFGHAWNEVWSDGAWRPIDSTPLEGGTAIGYLPNGILRDEGPGFQMEVWRLGVRGASAVRVLASE